MSQIRMTKEYTLDIGHMDARGIARPSAIVEFMQDLATRHAEEMGISGKFIETEPIIWVLSRLKYQLTRPLHSYEKIKLTTMPRDLRGATWIRDFVIEDANGVIGYAVTYWAIVNMETRRLVRPKSIGLDFHKQETGLTEMLRPIRVEGLEPCFDRVVRYSDIDVNRHLNNVKAVDILSDAFGLEEDEKSWVSQLQVNYIAESTAGTTLTLQRCSGENGSLYVSALDGETEKVQAEAVFSSME